MCEQSETVGYRAAQLSRNPGRIPQWDNRLFSVPSKGWVGFADFFQLVPFIDGTVVSLSRASFVLLSGGGCQSQPNLGLCSDVGVFAGIATLGLSRFVRFYFQPIVLETVLSTNDRKKISVASDSCLAWFQQRGFTVFGEARVMGQTHVAPACPAATFLVQ